MGASQERHKEDGKKKSKEGSGGDGGRAEVGVPGLSSHLTGGGAQILRVYMGLAGGLDGNFREKN